MNSTILYFVAIGILIVSIFLSILVKSTFRKLSKKTCSRHMTGSMVANAILRQNGVSGVSVNCVQGELSDHYNPRDKSVNLSSSVYSESSIAAVAVAAHECGHAIQHNTNYIPLKIRTAILPIASIGTNVGYIVFLIGMIFSMATPLMDIGIILFSFAVLFQFITLPIEFNASRRGLKALAESGILCDEEMPGARKMLRRAAYTYVAAAAATAIQLLRLIALRNRR